MNLSGSQRKAKMRNWCFKKKDGNLITLWTRRWLRLGSHRSCELVTVSPLVIKIFLNPLSCFNMVSFCKATVVYKRVILENWHCSEAEYQSPGTTTWSPGLCPPQQLGRELVWRSPTLTYHLLFRLETECREQNCLNWQTFLSDSDFPLVVVMRKEKGKPIAGNPLCHRLKKTNKSLKTLMGLPISRLSRKTN